MTFQYRLCILFGLLVLSVGCSDAVRIDASSETRFKETYEAMRKSLSEYPAKQQKLDFAFGMIGVGYLGSGAWRDGITFKEIDGMTYEELIKAANKRNERSHMDIDALFAGRDRLSKVTKSKMETIASEQQDDLKKALQTIQWRIERELNETLPKTVGPSGKAPPIFIANGVTQNRVADIIEEMSADQIIAHSKSLDKQKGE